MADFGKKPLLGKKALPKKDSGIFTGDNPFISFGGVKKEPPMTLTPEEQELVNQGKPTREILSKVGHDDTIIPQIKPLIENLRNYGTNRIATNPYLPESLKPYAAAATSLVQEPLRLGADILNSGFGLATLGSFKKPSVVEPTVEPPVVEPKTNYQIIPQKNILTQVPKAEDTLLGNIVKNYDDPSATLDAYRRVNNAPSGLQRYFAVDKDIQNELALKQAARDAKFNSFAGNTNPEEIPASPYSTRMGVERNTIDTPVGPDASLYRTVPERLYPRRSQTQLEALTPNRLKTATTEEVKPKLESWKPLLEEKPKESLPANLGEIANTEKARSGVKSPAEVFNPKAVQEVTLDPSVPAPIREAVKRVSAEDSEAPSSIRTSIYTQLGRIGGEELVNKAQRAVHSMRRMGNDFIRPYINMGKQLSKDERANFGRYVEGSLPSPNERVTKAVQAWNEAQNALGQSAEQAGIRLYKGDKFEPFKRLEGPYWPRVPAGERQNFIDKLVSQGKTIDEAEDLFDRMRRNGEIVHGFQNVRNDVQFDYKTDFDTGIAHLRNLAKRVSQHTEFGPLDVNGRGEEGIFDLISATKDPKLANTLMSRIIGRDHFSIEKFVNRVNWAKKFSAITKLKDFTMPNIILGQMTNAVKSTSHPVEVMGELRNLLKKSYRDDLRSAGILEDVAYTLGEEFEEGFKHLKDPFAIGAGETINRYVGGAVGKAIARGHFNALKNGVDNPGFKKELSELLSENIDDVLKQDKLTDKQLKQAAGRMAEITQGLNIPGNLPYHWSDPINSNWEVGKQMVLIFKKIGFQNTKTLWNTVNTGTRADRARNIASLVALAQVAGTLVGGSKAATKAIWSGDLKKEWEKRDDWVIKLIGKDHLRSVSKETGIPPWVITRALDNMSQSFMLGLPADLAIGATTSPTGLIESLGGPVLGDLSELTYDTGQLLKGNSKPIKKKLLKSLPLPGGNALADKIK